MVGEEARSLTIMESMACGVPPVVSAIADLPIMVGDAGVVVQTNRFKEEIGSFAGLFLRLKCQLQFRSYLRTRIGAEL